MPHDAPLIATIVAGFVLAFAFGALANRLRAPPLVGYLIAGIAIGPYTPGFHADQQLTPQLAEIGVILLMFGVGLHFSVKDLLAVKAIAVPGAIAQIAIATLMGMGLAAALGWPIGGGLVFGLALSVASTVVLLRALEGRHLVETQRGRIAVGWLVVEDLAMVLILVLLPAVAGLLGGGGGAGPSGDAGAPPGALAIATAVAITIGKVAAFVAVMLIVGRRFIPWLLHHIAHTGSRELFRLAVLAIALGFAYGAAQLFDVSLALGAFFAGMVLNESELSHQAANESLPLRDAFAVLFFVSVGMLFDPMIVVRETWALLATLLIIVVGKSLASFAIVRAFGHSTGTALMISASLAQIGEFSFILAGLGVTLGLMPETGRALILGGAILSIFLNPLAFELSERLRTRLKLREGVAPDGGRPLALALPTIDLADHAVVVGYGRVGSLVGAALADAGRPFAVIEERDGLVASLRQAGVPAILGNGAAAAVIEAANLKQARWLVVAIPNAFEAGQIVAQARAANPQLEIVARAHFDAEVEHLRGLGANTVIMGEREIARAMIGHILPAPASL